MPVAQVEQGLLEGSWLASLSFIVGAVVAGACVSKFRVRMSEQQLTTLPQPQLSTSNPLSITRDSGDSRRESLSDASYEHVLLRRVFLAWQQFHRHPVWEDKEGDRRATVTPESLVESAVAGVLRARLRKTKAVQFSEHQPLGMELREAHHSSLAAFGLIEVGHVDAHGPAAAAGVREGQLLTNVNERDVLSYLSQGRLADVLRMLKARPIELTFAWSPHDHFGRDDHDQSHLGQIPVASVQDVRCPKALIFRA